MSGRRGLIILILNLPLALLLPGLLLPVITVQGNLNPEGVARLAPAMLDASAPSPLEALRPQIGETLYGLLEPMGEDLRTGMISAVSDRMTAELRAAPPIEVYSQTRSIVGSVRHLYSVGSFTAATLILLFSILVPVAKTLVASWSVWQRDLQRRSRASATVSMIAKWSMADVFAVALFITYLAAQASQAPSPEGIDAPVVNFSAGFGPGFFWFAGYCLASLAIQQWVARRAGAEARLQSP